jgi:hypothetical protein
MGEEKKRTAKIVRCPVCGEELDTMGKRAHFLNRHPDLNYEEYKDKFEVVRVEERIKAKTESEEEEEGREGRTPWRTPPSPTEILKEILDEYGVKEEAKRIILRKSERFGGLDPNALYDLLRDLNTGIPDKAIHHLTDDYYWALRRAEQQAREMGMRVRYPLPSWEFGEERRPIYERPYPTYEREYRYGGYYPPSPSERYGPPDYGGYARTSGPTGPRPLTQEDLERWWREKEERQKREELERWVYRDLPEKVRKETEEKIESVKSELSSKIDEILSTLRDLKEGGGKKSSEETSPLLKHLEEELRLTEERRKEDIERLEKEHEKELEKLMEQIRELREELKEERKQREEERRRFEEEKERLRAEAERSKTGRTAYDLAHEVVQTAKDWIETKPGERLVKVVFYGPTPHKKKLEETEEAKPKVEELLPEDLVEEE